MLTKNIFRLKQEKEEAEEKKRVKEMKRKEKEEIVKEFDEEPDCWVRSRGTSFIAHNPVSIGPRLLRRRGRRGRRGR